MLSKSAWMATVATIGVGAWMLTGLARDAEAPPDEAGLPAEHAATRVAVVTSQARAITRTIVISARTEPNRNVTLRAETEGRVVALGAERGTLLRAGQRIAELDMRDRAARMEEARAAIAHVELQYEAAKKLETRQFVSAAQLAELMSRVVAARATLAEIELEIGNTTLVAPFDALLEDRLVEIGDYVNAGDTVAELVDTDPLIVVGDVSERDVHKLEIGNLGAARLANGTTVEGAVRYVAPVAAESTRTFRVELAIANAGGALRAGMTAEMRLAAEEVTVHTLSPALLTLDDAGTVGVKTVGDDNRVRFHAVEIVESTSEGIAVTGLPHELRVITVGHGFVKPGDVVEPSFAPAPTEITEAASGAPRVHDEA
jgi:multidrug efflux system membrane fusion protein